MNMETKMLFIAFSLQRSNETREDTKVVNIEKT